MITIFCLVVYGKMPDKVLGLYRFGGLVLLELLIMYVLFWR